MPRPTTTQGHTSDRPVPCLDPLVSSLTAVQRGLEMFREATGADTCTCKAFAEIANHHLNKATEALFTLQQCRKRDPDLRK